MEPHSTQKKARDCRDCHQNPKVLGLGFGEVYLEGKRIRFRPLEIPLGNAKGPSLSQVADPEGRPLVKFNRQGLRPFNAKEIKAILKVGICLSCHRGDDPIFRRWREGLRCPRIKSLP